MIIRTVVATNPVQLFAIVAVLWGSSSPMPSIAQETRFEVSSWVSTEWHPMDSRWYTNPWPESEIPRKLEPREPILLTQPGDKLDLAIMVDPYKQYQSIRGLGTSLEHTTVYAIRKNKSQEQQRTLLSTLIDPKDGIGLNLFRISIGTSDFADGTRATPMPDNPKGWYSYQDTPASPFSIERDISLGIIDTLKMAVEVGNANNNPIKFVASAWSPPRWMRERDNMVQGGPLLAEQYEAYATYLRKFVEAYQAHGIPIYAMSMQNERQFEPGAYPGMVMTWEEEQKLLLTVYENFQNISGDHGEKLNVKLWTLDHNFSYWQQADAQIDSLKSLGKDHYLDATAFHHYEGTPEQMSMLHMAHPDKDIIFTEGSLWGLNGDNNRRGFETLIRHFRSWSTGYIAWVTMTTQTLDEANQGPYNGLGIFDPTMLVKNDGDNPDWYRTPEYWLLGQFSKFIQPGAKRIDSDYGSLQRLTNVAFLNPDNSIVMVVANSTSRPQTLTAVVEGNQLTDKVPAKSIVSYQWALGPGQSPHAWSPLPEPKQTPYENIASSIPGIIQTENYDEGGFDVAYFDMSDGNTGGFFRADDVDIESNDNGAHVGWVQQDEWMEYTVQVSDSGTYELTTLAAAEGQGGSYQLSIGTKMLAENISVAGTGGWQIFENQTHDQALALESGQQVLRLTITDGEFNIDAITFDLVSPKTNNPTDPKSNTGTGAESQAGGINLPSLLVLIFGFVFGPLKRFKE